MFYLDEDHKETMIKGDTMLDDHRRVILISTDAQMETLARAKTILGDGTFKIAPSLWTQVFIISAQVDTDVFVPCCYAMLPDKTRDSYNSLFSMLKECLSRRGLIMSAQFFMSDFELNIKNSFMEFFPQTEVKGCVFHFAKAVVGQVHKRGFKQDFSDVRKNGAFCGFIRAILGLPYVPLERLKEGIRNLYIICRRLTGKQQTFGMKMIKYVEKYWIRGNHRPVTWNVYKSETVSTNNNSEGYNSKLGNKLKQHPNFYALCGELKNELETSQLDTLAAKTGNKNIKKNKEKKTLKLEKIRCDMKDKLENGLVELMIYQQTMGGMITIPDVSSNLDGDEENIFNDQDHVADGQSDDPIEIPNLESIFVPLPVVHESNNAIEDVEVSNILVHQAQTAAASKNANQVSDVEYRHINASKKRLSELSYSVRGNDLRQKRRRLNNGAEKVVYDLTNVNLLADIAINASSSKQEILDFFGLKDGDKLTLEQGEVMMDLRLEQIKFEKSKSLPQSPRDGNCLMACLVDQVNKGGHIMSGCLNSNNCRDIIATFGYNLMKNGRLHHSGDHEQFFNPENWHANMVQNGVFGDEIFLRAASNLLSSNIIIYKALKSSATRIEPLQPARNIEIFLFLYEESDFISPHYESIFKSPAHSDQDGSSDLVTETLDVHSNETEVARSSRGGKEGRRGRGRGRGQSRGKGRGRGRPKGSYKKQQEQENFLQDNTVEEDYNSR